MSTSAARRFLDDALAGVPVDRHLAALLVTELVANVVVHAATDMQVVATVGPVVRVEVRDGAAATAAFRKLVADPPHHLDPSAWEGGRGLMLVARLAARFGLDDHGATGKAVWFELPIAGARGS